MAFLLNKTTLIFVAILVIITLCWALSSTRTRMKRAEENLGIFEDAESLKVEAYKSYQDQIEALKAKVKIYKEKINALEQNPDNTYWLETDIPADIDNSIPR